MEMGNPKHAFESQLSEFNSDINGNIIFEEIKHQHLDLHSRQHSELLTKKEVEELKHLHDESSPIF